jgi:MFS family permease
VLATTTLLPVAVVGLIAFGGPAGVGLTLFQELIPRPGLASGMYANTRRLGAIVSGPIIGLAAMTALGYQGVFTACAALTVLALVVLRLTGRRVRVVHSRYSALISGVASTRLAGGEGVFGCGGDCFRGDAELLEEALIVGRGPLLWPTCPR